MFLSELNGCKEVIPCSMLTGYPLHGRLAGRPGLGGYWGVSDFSSVVSLFAYATPGLASEGLMRQYLISYMICGADNTSHWLVSLCIYVV